MHDQFNFISPSAPKSNIVTFWRYCLEACPLTETALLSNKNEVHLALARGEATTVILLNQCASFDTIHHGTLINCLSSWFGVGGVVLDWFKSYFSDPFQCIKNGSVLSNDIKRLLYGVPPGLCLGSLLFSLHTTPPAK